MCVCVCRQPCAFLEAPAELLSTLKFFICVTTYTDLVFKRVIYNPTTTLDKPIIFSIPPNAHLIWQQFTRVHVRKMVTFLDYLPDLFDDPLPPWTNPPPPLPTEPYPSPPPPPPPSPMHESTTISRRMTMTAGQPPQLHHHHHVSHTQQPQQPTQYLDYHIPMTTVPLPYSMRYETDEENLAFLNEIRQTCTSFHMHGLPRRY